MPAGGRLIGSETASMAYSRDGRFVCHKKVGGRWDNSLL